MQEAPLQTYASALVFSPRESQIRKQNLFHYPKWFKGGPAVEDHWGITLQTLESPKGSHSDYLGCLVFSFDGNYLASSQGNTISLWNPTTGILVSTLEGHRERIISITFSRKGQLASASADGEVRVWDPVTGVTCSKLELGLNDYRRRDVAAAAAFTPDGTLACSYDDDIRLWNPEAVALPVLVNSKFILIELAFLSSGNLAIACVGQEFGYGEEILVYDPGINAERRIASPRFEEVSFSSNDHVALATDNGTVRVYNLMTGDYLTLRATNHNISALAFSFNNESLFAGDFSGTVYHWNLTSGIGTLLGTYSRPFSSTASSPDSKLALALDLYSEVRLWNVASIWPSPHGEWSRNRYQTVRRLLAPRSLRSDPIKLVEFSRNGKQLASAPYGGILTLWDSVKRRETHILHGHEGIIFTAKFSMTGNYLAFGCSNGEVLVWVPAYGKLLNSLERVSGPVSALAFSPNDEVLVSGSMHGEVQIWDSKPWHLQHTLHLDDIRSIAFSQNGRRIAYLNYYKDKDYCREIQIWDAEQHIHLRNIRILEPNLETGPWTRPCKKEIICFFESYIYTNFGRIQLDQSHATLSEERDTPTEKWKVQDDWLFHDGQRKLWLPPDFRPTCTAIYDDLFVLGHESGKLTFFDGNTDDSTPECALEATAPDNRRKARRKGLDIYHHQKKNANISKPRLRYIYPSTPAKTLQAVR